MPGNAMPWSVVEITSVFSASPADSSASRTVPTPSSRTLADGFKRGHVLACKRRVGHGRGRLGETRIFLWTGLMEFAMRFEESDVEKERLIGRRASGIPPRPGATCATCVPCVATHFVVTDGGGLLGDVLHADQRRTIAVRPQRMQDMLVVIVQRKPAVRQAEHAVLMRTLAGQQAARLGEQVGAASERPAETEALTAKRCKLGVGTA